MIEFPCIGIFDSGVGGASMLQPIMQEVPTARLTYVADSSYCPYGSKTSTEVVQRSELIASFLIDAGCQAVVVACNSATTVSMEHLRSTFTIPFVGIEPGVKPAAAATRSGIVGLLATERTIDNPLYHATRDRWAKDVKVIETAGIGLVELVEAGELAGIDTEQLLRSYIEPMLENGADQIALGCTHYLLLMPVVHRIVDGRADIIDPRPAVARQVKAVLQSAVNDAPATTPQVTFCATGCTQALSRIIAKLKLPGGAIREIQV